jgi:hypothetical protein
MRRHGNRNDWLRPPAWRRLRRWYRQALRLMALSPRPYKTR